MIDPNLIRYLREARSMTRPNLALRSGTSRSHLWSIENGHIVPGIATLEKLSEALGVGLNRLLAKSDAEMLLEDPFVQKIQLLLPRLSDASRLQILNTLQAAPKKRGRIHE